MASDWPEEKVTQRNYNVSVHRCNRTNLKVGILEDKQQIDVISIRDLETCLKMNEFNLVQESVGTDQDETQFGIVDSEIKWPSEFARSVVEVCWEEPVAKPLEVIVPSSSLLQKTKSKDNSRPLVCPKCKYRAKYHSSLELHLRSHSKESPFACPHCGFNCWTEKQLVYHLRIHSEKYPLKYEKYDVVPFRSQPSHTS